ncbi:methyltransferase regulatory domain-containing protein [Rickettsiaceae bacterium]|nr:methyltransferase regulatory domain-containing protein [Rickettsiaceae bacterium]
MEVKEQGYDELPYDSLAFDYNRPENLKSCAALFGMETPALENARILELGCADGFNLYRFSETYPKSYTLGVDLSEAQIDNGKKIIKELGLQNMELKAMSITDLDESYGTFDYIICHGVFSWVPELVRDGIIEVSKKLPSEKGVAFISYNTLPGWNTRRSIRDLMLYHSSYFTNTKDRIAQSRAVLSFIQDSVKGTDTPYAKYLKHAVDHISDKTDSYLRHEYLAEENESFYFHEFMDMAKKQKLNYLCDTDIQKMYAGNLPKGAAEALSKITDPIKLEQYMDFITNNQFRCTVLCHEGISFSRTIQSDTLKKFHYYSYIVPKTPKDEVSLTDNSNLVVEDTVSKKTMATTDPNMKAILMSLCENLGNPLTISEIIDYTKKLAPEARQEVIEANINTNFPRLILSNLIKFVEDKPKAIFETSKKPKVSKFNLLQINRTGYQGKTTITNALNGVMACEVTQSSIVKMLDGSRTIAQIESETVENFKKGVISANEDGKKIEDEARLKKISTILVSQTLEHMRRNFFLVA